MCSCLLLNSTVTRRNLDQTKPRNQNEKRVLLLFQMKNLANERSQKWVHLRGEKRYPSGGKIAWLSPFMLLPRFMQVQIMAQTQTAIHCMEEAMGDLPSIYNSSFLFTVFRSDQFEG